MVKTKKIIKVGGKQKKKPMKQVDVDALDSHGVAAAKMLMDPCGAPLAPSVYPGDIGYLGRFNSRFQGGAAAGETVNVMLFKPGNNLTYNISTTALTGSFTVGWVDTQAPGAGFLNGVGDKCRALGACAVVQPNAAPSNATGIIYYGNLPASMFAQGKVVDYAAALAACTHQVTVSQALMQPLEVRWSPGTFDDRYSPTSGITSDDDSDRNVICVVTIGLAPATGVSFRLAAIYEWAPTSNSGAAYDGTTVKQSRCDISCVLRNLKRKDPEWWWSLGKKVIKLGRETAIGYYTGGPLGAVARLGTFV